jgi:hypothetical protein
MGMEVFFSMGNVNDRQRPEQPSEDHEKCAHVAASLLQSPKKSLREQSLESGIPETSV